MTLNVLHARPPVAPTPDPRDRPRTVHDDGNGDRRGDRGDVQDHQNP